MLTSYNVSPIALALLVIYAASFALYKTGRIRITTHRRIWNVLLLVTFLTTSVFGIILAIRRDYALLFSFPVNLLFWHVEAGIVMSVVSVFHLSWHFGYYRDLLRRSREAQRTEGGFERVPCAGRNARASSSQSAMPPASGASASDNTWHRGSAATQERG